MGNLKGEKINYSELCKLIEIYKRASIDGDRVDFVVYPEGNKRVITLKLQQGYSMQPLSYLFEDGELFDNEICSKLLSVFLSDDSFGEWNITSKDDELFNGVIEAHSGNVIYLDTYNKDLFDKLFKNIEIKKGKITIEDKVWDEIICYANNRKLLSSLSLTDDEVDVVYNYISERGIEDSKVKYGNTKKAIVSNENYLIELLGNRDELVKNGFPEEIASKINPLLIKQLAILLGNEKRIRYRLDLDDENIDERIKFAVFELDSEGFFDLKNKLTREIPTIECKMGVISKLLSQLNHGKLYTEELNNQYKCYCYEIVGYLYRKGIDGNFDVDNSITFEEYSTNEEEKNTNEMTSQEIEDIISFVEDSKSDGAKDKDLFRVVKQKNEEQESDESLELEDAYEKALEYSTESSPSLIKILFEGEDDNEADVIIANTSLAQDLVLYRRSIEINKLKNEIMNTLRKLYANNNSIHFNIKYKLDATNNYCLLLVGDKRATFSIVNASEDFVDDNKRKLEEMIGYKA